MIPSPLLALLETYPDAPSGFGIRVANNLLWAVVGASVMVLLVAILQRRKVLDAETRARKIITRAEAHAAQHREQILAEATIAIAQRREALDRELDAQRAELRDRQAKLESKQDDLEQQLKTLLAKEESLESKRDQLEASEHALAAERTALQAEQGALRTELARIAGLSVEDARQALLNAVEADVQRECGELVRRRYQAAVEDVEHKVKDVMVTAIQRLAAPTTVASTVTAIDLPNDEMKGRIIGREGRNIRAFEKATGAEVIVDDTPGVISVSCFDPVRREVANQSMRRLIEDGRIHPVRIEEVVAETAQKVEQQVKQFGQDAAVNADVPNLPPRLIELLGRLHFRTSYAQNVLAHSVEVALLTGMMAAELKLDAALARRAGLLHDIGKALDHELEGSHTVIGADLCSKLGEPEAVVNAALAHHGGVAVTTLYTPLVAAADSISAARPGARRESLERYVKRMEQLEAIALAMPGVTGCFAVQAGREVRVIVDAAKVDDAACQQLARDIAKRIETELTYPGEIRVSVVREMKVVEYAR